jgi:hypothetical protein
LNGGLAAEPRGQLGKDNLIAQKDALAAAFVNTLDGPAPNGILFWLFWRRPAGTRSRRRSFSSRIFFVCGAADRP